MQFIRRIRLPGVLSYPPDMEFLDLKSLNVLIGPNASGKTNLIEAFELLHATPTDFAAAIRDGGGPAEWLWKGDNRVGKAKVELETGEATPSTGRPLRYFLEFTSSNRRVEVLDEAIEEVEPYRGHDEPYFYYRFQRGRPVMNVKGIEGIGRTSKRRLERDNLDPDQSVLAQHRDPELHPEVNWIGKKFGQIQMFRDWTFGRYATLRREQPADLPENRLLPNNRNLALVLNQIEHRGPRQFNKILKRFLPRFERMSTALSGGNIQFFLHESGFSSPVSATRLSDGTVRFVAILATLLAPSPPPLVCIEEPELGLHPDALTLIAELLIKASERMQIVVTTHSDALVSALTGRPETIIVCERPGPETVLKRINQDRLVHWLQQDYALGDVWRLGEIGGNP